MSVLNILTNKLVSDFNEFQHPGTNKLVPRVGHYYIRSVEYREVGMARNSTPIATVNWTTSINKPFLEHQTFDISLSSLFENKMDENMNLASLVNNTIYISEIGLSHYLERSKMIGKVNIKWHRTDIEVRFLSTSNLSIDSLFNSGDSKDTAGEAWARLEATQPDLREAVMDEADYEEPKQG